MLARSGKVSMATKKRSGEEINDRQILCGMGIKLRRLTAGTQRSSGASGLNCRWSLLGDTILASPLRARGLRYPT